MTIGGHPVLAWEHAPICDAQVFVDPVPCWVEESPGSRCTTHLDITQMQSARNSALVGLPIVCGCVRLACFPFFFYMVQDFNVYNCNNSSKKIKWGTKCCNTGITLLSVQNQMNA